MWTPHLRMQLPDAALAFVQCDRVDFVHVWMLYLCTHENINKPGFFEARSLSGMTWAGVNSDVGNVPSPGNACVPNPCDVGSLFVFL